jgi:hypothetical protein
MNNEKLQMKDDPLIVHLSLLVFHLLPPIWHTPHPSLVAKGDRHTSEDGVATIGVQWV